MTPPDDVRTGLTLAAGVDTAGWPTLAGQASPRSARADARDAAQSAPDSDPQDAPVPPFVPPSPDSEATIVASAPPPASPDTDATILQPADRAPITDAPRPRADRPSSVRPSTARLPSGRSGSGIQPARPATGGANGGAHVGNAQHMEPGEAFGARYRITRMLGVGGMGAVYQAWDAELGVTVAIITDGPLL